MKGFDVCSKIVFGQDSLNSIKNIVASYKVNKAMIICDRGIVKAGIVDKVIDQIGDSIEVVIYDEVNPNPSDKLIEDCAAKYRDAGIGIIIAVGGGSSMDAAKAINVRLSNPEPINRYEGFDMVTNETMPLIAIPTTSGTASEVTGVSVITDTARKVKMVIGGKHVNADYAIVDPKLTVGLPPSITAATGMDALTHAIESYVSTLATVYTEVNSLKSIELISANIVEAYNNGSNIEARENMINGSVLAGLAFNCAILGLVHGIAHPLGAHFNVPHGVANAIMLPYVFEYNGPCIGEKLGAIAVAMGLSKDVELGEVVDRIKELNTKLSIPSLADYGVSIEDIDLLADAAMAEPSLGMNPREVKREDVIAILKEVLAA